MVVHMEIRSWVIAVILLCVIIALSVKIYLMRRAAEEIREGMRDKLTTETNTLLTISSRDKYMRELAGALNEELRSLRTKRHCYQQGDWKLKEAVTNISHDIRTPLTAIFGYLELLGQLLAKLPGQEEESETARRYLDVIKNRAEALKQLTEELLQYSVVVSETSDIFYEDVILQSILEESISGFYAALQANGITPVIKMPDRNIKCRLNKNALSRIFSNIIGNAVKYSDGDLCITLSENGEIVFSNHASGLDEVQVGKLFDRFYTVEAAKKSTGLGLSIARMLTEQMGGSIAAHYQEGVLSIHIFFPNTLSGLS